MVDLGSETSLLGDDDDILLKIESELADMPESQSGGVLGEHEEEDRHESEMLLNELLDTSGEVRVYPSFWSYLLQASGGFTAEWEAAFREEEGASGDLLHTEGRRESLTDQSFLPSNLFSLSALAAPPTNNQATTAPSSDKNEWFKLFADLDPLANPDSVGGPGGGDWDGGC